MERKEAIEIVRKLYNESLFLKKDKEAMVTLLPELAESEDERIRKDIIRCLKYSGIQPDRPINPHVRTTMKDAIAWLEKQGDIVKNNMLLPFKEYDNLMDSINKKKKEGYEAGYKQGLSDSKSEQRPILDIEIPFGAKDSELIEESISIPKGCYAIIKDNKIVIRKELCHQD